MTFRCPASVITRISWSWSGPVYVGVGTGFVIGSGGIGVEGPPITLRE